MMCRWKEGWLLRSTSKFQVVWLNLILIGRETGLVRTGRLFEKYIATGHAGAFS